MEANKQRLQASLTEHIQHECSYKREHACTISINYPYGSTGWQKCGDICETERSLAGEDRGPTEPSDSSSRGPCTSRKVVAGALCSGPRRPGRPVSLGVAEQQKKEGWMRSY